MTRRGFFSTLLDFHRLTAQKDELIHDYRTNRYESLLSDQIALERGHARFVDANTVEVNGKHLSGDKVLIATGSRPSLPPIEGLDEVPFLTSDLLTSDRPMKLTECPRSLLVVGGGYIALELGQMYQRFGAQVTILERSHQLLSHRFEPGVGPVVETILREEGVQVITGTLVARVRQERDAVVATARVGEDTREFRAERLLVATGRQPNTDNVAIEKAGVAVGEQGQVLVDAYLRTNVPHIFAAGDVVGTQVGTQMATPVGSQDGGIAAHNALSGEPPRKVNHRVIPRAIFTDPQIATVGLTEEEAIAAGHPCWCNTIPMSLVPRARAIRDTRGIIKMVADANTDEVLGVTMVGHNAGEVIHEAAMGLRFRAELRDFIDLLHVYPTMAEALKIIAISRYKDPARLTCCAQ